MVFGDISRNAAMPQTEFFETILNNYKLLVIIAKSCGKHPVVDWDDLKWFLEDYFEKKIDAEMLFCAYTSLHYMW